MAEHVRWGILGTAMIARKNWASIKNAPNATLVAVASRSEERAAQYIDECQSQVPHETKPRAIGSYEEMIAADDIDAIYVPLPTGTRAEWCIKAANAGKHVLGEKPCGVDVAELESILHACKANNVQYMDGVMFMHSARLPKMRETLDDKESVGDLRRIQSGFSFMAPADFIENNIRINSDLEPMGCLGDLGWYNIRISLFAMNYEMPSKVSGRLLTDMKRDDSPNPVPLEFSGELFWDNGVSAGFYCSFVTGHQQWTHISGTNGYLELPDFVLPFFSSEVAFDVGNHELDLHGCVFNMQEHTRRVPVREYGNNEPGAQETNLFANFSSLVQSGTPDNSWGEIALKTQKVMDACYASAKANGLPRRVG
jgi:predicted dehydrogenase